VLDTVAVHRFLTTTQLQAFVFAAHASDLSAARTCRRVLRRLESWQLLERLDRRIGGLQAGSTSSIWLLTPAGQRLRNLHAGGGALTRVREPGQRFVQHYLAVADAHLALLGANRAAQLDLLQLEVEPACWRPYAGLGGSAELLKPDLYAVIATGQFEVHWFIEVDRATESMPTVVRQCRQYEAYRRTGSEQAASGLFPYVLWVVPDDRRAGKLQGALAAAHGLDRELFRITTPERVLTLITGGIV